MMIWKSCLSLLIALSLLALLDALRPHRAIIISSSSGTSINAARSTTRLNLTLEKYLQELNDSSVGRVRFVVIGAGSILEAVGSFSNLRYSQTPRGKLATISTDEAFECHFKIDAIASVKHAKGDTVPIYRTSHSNSYVLNTDKLISSEKCCA